MKRIILFIILMVVWAMCTPTLLRVTDGRAIYLIAAVFFGIPYMIFE